tara:strand:- start:8734 stop:8925 length:192 start_codon:yes stop_codon:yes gene_type:complete
MTAQLIVGNTYKFSHGTDTQTLTYLGYNWSGNGHWHQFSKQGSPAVWSEITNDDLWMIEEVYS